MTGFVFCCELFAIDSFEISRALVSQIITVIGLPTLMIVDAGSEFAGTVISVCNTLCAPQHVVTKGNHKAILAEQFHRYLNKIQQLHAAECSTVDDWAQGIALAVYAWNSAPVDSTNLQRSWAAIGRHFILPVQQANQPTDLPNNLNWGELTMNYVEGAFPLLSKQQELLQILTEERKEHHRNLKNQGHKQNEFAVGDLVLVWKQVTTSTDKGPAKRQLRARGPYQVLEKLLANTYQVIRLPFIGNQHTHHYVPYKESAARMEKLSSTVVILSTPGGTDRSWS